MASEASQQQTLSSRLMACLGRNEMTDIHLVGTDGVAVPAYRNVLACRSDVFRTMLLGNFKESSSDTIKLDYGSEVLKAVVDFCITNDVRAPKINGCNGCDADETAGRGMVQLIACSHFLNMPLLQEKAQPLVNTLLNAHQGLACAIFDEASLFGEPTESVKMSALDVIRKFPRNSFLANPGIVALTPETLRAVMSDNDEDDLQGNRASPSCP